MRKHNLQTHSTLSDGSLEPRRLVQLAQQKNLEILGITDHAFTDKLPPTHQITSSLIQYLEDLREVQESLSETSSFQLKIGIEIDVSKHYGINPMELPFSVLNGFDYILFEYVNTETEYWGTIGKRDIQDLLDIRTKLKVPIGLAHNDLQNNFQGEETRIAKILSNYDIFLELNQSEWHPRRGAGRNTRDGQDYYLHFSQELIQELLTHRVKVVIGTDSHTGESIGEINQVTQFIEEYKFQLHEMVL
ncbi:MAG: PHP domain-containing protein [Candidatus Heimdallarchaeota archaeon]